MIAFFVGLILTTITYHIAYRQGHQHGMARMNSFYGRFINNLRWDIRREVREEFKKYISKRYT